MARMTDRVMLSDPVKARLARLAVELSAAKGRDVTYNETVEELLNHLDGNSWVMRDIVSGRSA